MCSLRMRKHNFSVIAIKIFFSIATSIVSRSKVSSVEMDFCSLYGSTGELSIPFAFLQMMIPFSPKTFSISSTGISWSVFTHSIPMLRSNWYVFSPIIGIFLTDNGARKFFSSPKSIFIWLLGLASSVATLLTVLFALMPREIGKPVSCMIFSRNSVAYL